ncbi:MAG: signal peptide peptidase SppA, partial [Mycobacterium sp.]|nr:signal peptide peptidase SppA [Mycobacterium sp.]
MRSLLPSLPGLDVPGLIRRVDTVRHHGVPGGCILEANLQSVPPETAGFDPVRLVTGAGRPLLLR